MAYMGAPITIDKLLYRPEDSFVELSRHSWRSLRSIYAVNGDGCGIGWYNALPTPGLFRSIQPAWNCENLRNLSEQISSRLFFAHVRAAGGTDIQESNCHPFRWGRFLFQHNGVIREYPRLKQQLDRQIAADLYPQMIGSTDTERLFFLALTLGLSEDPVNALARMAGVVESTAEAHSVRHPLIMTCAVTAGRDIVAVRYSSQGDSPSLYHSRNIHALKEVGGEVEPIAEGSQMILSEPLDDVSEHWEEIPEATVLVASETGLETRKFIPIR